MGGFIHAASYICVEVRFSWFIMRKCSRHLSSASLLHAVLLCLSVVVRREELEYGVRCHSAITLAVGRARPTEQLPKGNVSNMVPNT